MCARGRTNQQRRGAIPQRGGSICPVLHRYLQFFKEPGSLNVLAYQLNGNLPVNQHAKSKNQAYSVKILHVSKNSNEIRIMLYGDY